MFWYLQIAIALAANIGGQASPISSPQNLIALASMDVPLSWLQWFAISLPVATVSIVAIWAFLHVNYRWEHDLEIPRMRKNQDPLTMTHYYVLFVTLFTIALWCAEKSLEAWIGDMGIIAIIPIIAFFGTGILSKVRHIVRTVAALSHDFRRTISTTSIGVSYFWQWEALHWARLCCLPDFWTTSTGSWRTPLKERASIRCSSSSPESLW